MYSRKSIYVLHDVKVVENKVNCSSNTQNFNPKGCSIDPFAYLKKVTIEESLRMASIIQ
jgi:hypothetical protein